MSSVNHRAVSQHLCVCLHMQTHAHAHTGLLNEAKQTAKEGQTVKRRRIRRVWDNNARLTSVESRDIRSFLLTCNFHNFNFHNLQEIGHLALCLQLPAKTCMLKWYWYSLERAVWSFRARGRLRLWAESPVTIRRSEHGRDLLPSSSPHLLPSNS